MAINKIFLLHHTHVDFGYTDDRSTVEQQLVDMVDIVVDLAVQSSSRPEPERFRWINEISWPLLRYLERPGSRREELFALIRSGMIEMTALYVNPTDLFDRDTFEHSTRYAVGLAQRQRLPLDTAMFGDCPGIAWSVPDILSGFGLRYLSTAPDFIMSYPLEVERPFYWEGPNGGRLLTWFSDWRNWWYAEGLSGLGLVRDRLQARKNLQEYVTELEAGGYRWKGLAIHVAMDNEGPRPELMDFVRFWNEAESGVELRMSTNHDFFSYMEAEHGPEFAVHRASWPDWWANGHGSAAHEVSRSRRAKVSVRRCAALARHLGCESDDAYRQRLESILQNIIMFDEHTWGDHDSVDFPWCDAARLAWSEKRQLALKAMVHARRLERDLLSRVGAKGEVVVCNSSAEEIETPILLPATSAGRLAPELVETETKAILEGQRVKAGRTAGTAGDWYVVRVPPRTIQSYTRRRAAAERHGAEELETEHYRIRHDPKGGRITEVFDKELNRNLCDPAAPWGFAEPIHERVASRLGRKALYDVSLGSNKPEAKRPTPKFIRRGGDFNSRLCGIVAGPVYVASLSRGRLPGATFEREVRLYHDIRRIDVLLRVHKSARVKYESLYLAFPFAFDPAEVWIENAGAVFQAGKEQLPGSATDWLSLGEYLGETDGKSTALLVPHDVPLVQIGDINTGKWLRRLEVTSGHVYSWLMNNMWYTNFPPYQEGKIEFVWSLTSHAGAFDRPRAERFSSQARVGLCVLDRDHPAEAAN